MLLVALTNCHQPCNKFFTFFVIVYEVTVRKKANKNKTKKKQQQNLDTHASAFVLIDIKYTKPLFLPLSPLRGLLMTVHCTPYSQTELEFDKLRTSSKTICFIRPFINPS